MLQDITIPDTWETLEEFAQWFKDNGFPMRVPADMRIYVTDHSYSCVVFRQDVYQAELYMIAPDKPGSPHTHDFENLSIPLWGHISGWSRTPDRYNHLCLPSSIIDKNLPHPESRKIGTSLKIGEAHNIDTHEQGCLMYVMQKWNSLDEMTSAVIQYNGKPMWPLHAQIIKKQ